MRSVPNLVEWVPLIVVRVEWISEISEGWRVLPQLRISIAWVPGKYLGGGSDGGSSSSVTLLDFHGSDLGSSFVFLDLLNSVGPRLPLRPI